MYTSTAFEPCPVASFTKGADQIDMVPKLDGISTEEQIESSEDVRSDSVKESQQRSMDSIDYKMMNSSSSHGAESSTEEPRFVNYPK